MLQRSCTALKADSGGVIISHELHGISPYGEGEFESCGFAALGRIPQMENDYTVFQRFKQR